MSIKIKMVLTLVMLALVVFTQVGYAAESAATQKTEISCDYANPLCGAQ